MLTQEGLIERTRGALDFRRPEILRARVADAMRETPRADSIAMEPALAFVLDAYST